MVHGWGSSPKRGWFPWLKRELELAGFAVYPVTMPAPYFPDRITWLKTLSKAVGTPDEETYFIGHSLGCTTILLYLQKKLKTPIGGVICVAPWLDTMHPTWLQRFFVSSWKTRLLLSVVSRKVRDVITIFSDNDPIIPLTLASVCKKYFKVIIENKRYHFDDMLAGMHSSELVLKELHQMMQKV